MTNKEAITLLKKLRIFHNGTYAKSIDMAIEALQAKTDGDTISRQDAIEAFYEPKNGGTYAELNDGSEWYMTSKEIYAVLESLPSAEPKTGKWVKRQTIGEFCFAYCSECGEPILHGRTSPLWYYCPNCGADMRGGEEDGEKKRI